METLAKESAESRLKDLHRKAKKRARSKAFAKTDVTNDVEEEEAGDDVKSTQPEPTPKTFTVLGKRTRKSKSTQKIARQLPDWLETPRIISSDLTENLVGVDTVGVSIQLIKNLEKQNIKTLFPIQSELIPKILESSVSPLISSPSGYRPRDVCVSAPTGSGKTLAYVLPLLHVLNRVVVRRLRALIILPTQNLADQVKQVFDTYSRGLSVQIGLTTGQQTFTKEQEMLTESRGVDILITTPGRLVDHVTSTGGFSLDNVRFLIIDEADRLLGRGFDSWLDHVIKSKPIPNVENFVDITTSPPPQKLLFSATLSRDPEKLARLDLYNPILYATASTKYAAVPDGLSENYTVCTAGEKPLVLINFLHKLQFERMLCFASSVSNTHRLYHLIKAFGGVGVAEFSSGLTGGQRRAILDRFRRGDEDLRVLVASDAMARGMDVDDVSHVVSYDVPAHAKTHVHRVGRTARAGKAGWACTILREEEVRFFKGMMKEAGRTCRKLRVGKNELEGLVERYENALQQLEIRLRKEGRKKGN